MIYALCGDIQRVSDTHVVIRPDNSGIWYEAVRPVDSPRLEEARDKMRHGLFYIWHHQTADGSVLLAFNTEEERSLLPDLIKVQGIGAATAHRIITTLGYDELVRLIGSGQAGQIQKAVKGLGKKGASNITRDLQSKFKEFCVGGGDSRLQACEQALKTLGIRYDPKDEGDRNDLIAILAANPNDEPGTLVAVFARNRGA